MTRIFYDLEFLEDGRTIEPISIGMVREDGSKELYAVNDALLWHPHPRPDSLYQRVVNHRWLMENVVPQLPLAGWPEDERYNSADSGDPFFQLDPESPFVLPIRLIRAQVRRFVMSTPEPELWAWYGAYDHVALCQLFGKMIDLPKGFPMFTNDIRTLAMLAGPEARESEPKQTSGVHDALADARFNWRRYEHYAPLVDVRRLA